MKANYKPVSKENKWKVIERICNLLNISSTNEYGGYSKFAFELYRVKADALALVEKQLLKCSSKTKDASEVKDE